MIRNGGVSVLEAPTGLGAGAAPSAHGSTRRCTQGALTRLLSVL